MKKNPLLLFVVGALLLAIGGYITMGDKAARADPAIVAQCQDRVRDQGAELVGRCQEQAFATAMTATDANEAARTISAANNNELGGNALGMFLIGLGFVLAIYGAVTWRQQGLARAI
jgi:hypothetical protein